MINRWAPRKVFGLKVDLNEALLELQAYNT